MRKAALLILLLVCALSLTLSACTSDKEGYIFGTYYSLEIENGNAFKYSAYKKTIVNDWEELENLGSTQIVSSDVARINAAEEGISVTVTQFTINCINLAKKYNSLFSSFNPAVYPLVELWQFSPDRFVGAAERIPSTEEILAALEYCSLDCFTVDETALTVTKTDSRAKLDFGSFLKGVAADAAAETLSDTEYVVNVGGTVISNKEITVAVANPRGGDYRAKVTFSGKAVATSGDYERYYVVDGVRYHHIIGTDGYPAWVGETYPITSVTVVGDNATVCDILSTAVFVEGADADATLKLLGYSALILTDISARVIGADNAEWNVL